MFVVLSRDLSGDCVMPRAEVHVRAQASHGNTTTVTVLSHLKHTQLNDHLHGNSSHGKIPTKKEPIRTLRFASRLPCHVII